MWSWMIPCAFSSHSVHFQTSSGSGATIVETVAPVAEVVELGMAPGLASVPVGAIPALHREMLVSSSPVVV